MDIINHDLKVDPKDAFLTDAEKRRFFYFCRYRAIEALALAKNMQKLNVPDIPCRNEALRWLETARDVFPLHKDKETVSMEDIVNGREPT